MMRKAPLVAVTIGVLCVATAASAADRAARKAPVAPAEAVVERVQDCSRFYDPYDSRGFGPGSVPGVGVGFGTFEGALPMYPQDNSFPNWYGACVTWGRYNAAGSAPK
jgi:hypothetical protein